jgi:polyferredoxin
MVLALVLVMLVPTLSAISVRLWGGKKEAPSVAAAPVLSKGMSVGEFGRANHLPDAVLKKVFGLASQEEFGRDLEGFGLSRDEIEARVRKAMVVSAEFESKNWVRIPIKFCSWLVFLLVAFRLMRTGRVTPAVRNALYLLAIVLFGIVLGADPSPLGTVKDTIVLLGAKGVLFPPRLVALTVFLLLVVLANKFICSWGCQFGVLQDLLFRMNGTGSDRAGFFRQYKPSFAATNTIRAVFFAVFTAVAFLWAIDVVEPLDPFKIYKPAAIMLPGALFLLSILVAGLFIYRPWCHLFCPFGLVGWMFEKISIFKIKVNYDTCISCEACAGACPSTAMGSILKQDRAIPDCFSCGTCISACPTNSVHFRSGKRTPPPVGKFVQPEKKP